MTNCQGRHGGDIEARGLTFDFRMVGPSERAFCTCCGEMVRGIESPAAIEAHQIRMANPVVKARLAHLGQSCERKEEQPKLTPRAMKAYRIRRGARRRLVLAA